MHLIYITKISRQDIIPNHKQLARVMHCQVLFIKLESYLAEEHNYEVARLTLI